MVREGWETGTARETESLNAGTGRDWVTDFWENAKRGKSVNGKKRVNRGTGTNTNITDQRNLGVVGAKTTEGRLWG